MVLDVLFGEFPVYGQKKKQIITNCIFGVYVRPFNSSLRKYFNSIFLSTVMTLFKHFEIGPLFKKNRIKWPYLLKSVFVPKSTLIFIIEGLTNRWIVLVIDVVTVYLVLPIYRTRVSLLYVILKLLMTYHRVCKNSTRRVPHVEQELFILSGHSTWLHPWFLVWLVLLDL